MCVRANHPPNKLGTIEWRLDQAESELEGHLSANEIIEGYEPNQGSSPIAVQPNYTSMSHEAPSQELDIIRSKVSQVHTSMATQLMAMPQTMTNRLTTVGQSIKNEVMGAISGRITFLEDSMNDLIRQNAQATPFAPSPRVKSRETPGIRLNRPRKAGFFYRRISSSSSRNDASLSLSNECQLWKLDNELQNKNAQKRWCAIMIATK